MNRGQKPPLTGELPPIWPLDPLPLVRGSGSKSTVLVVDDDPTGTQTVRDVLVTTRWDSGTLKELMSRDDATSFVLTNSRSLDPTSAESIAMTIGRRIREASLPGSQTTVISRSDSTLRGHFPGEVFALLDGLEWEDAKILLAPYFGDAGRVTIWGTHYLRGDNGMTPVADTEFARDPLFGYRSSNIERWVRERGVHDRQITHLHIDMIRRHGPEGVRQSIVDAPERSIVVADSLQERDIEVVAAGTALAEREGQRVLARTAASYVRARAGLPQSALLRPDEFGSGEPGLVAFGSHTATSNKQLDVLLNDKASRPVGVEIPLAVVSPDLDRRVLAALGKRIDAHLVAHETPVLFTDRTSRVTGDPEVDRSVSAMFSKALVHVVMSLGVDPGWILAKGGITSSDIATDALGVTLATVRGQIRPGVPLWTLGHESRYPDLPYVVFPGNVGTDSDVRDVVHILAGFGRPA